MNLTQMILGKMISSQKNESPPSKSKDMDPTEGDVLKIPLIPKDRYDLRILRSIRQLIRSVDTYSKKLALERGLTVPQLVCLMKLDEIGSLPVKQLAEEAFISPSTVVGIVDRLEKHDVVYRERSVLDRRLVRIGLTDKGKKILANNPSPFHETFTEALHGLPELEKATIALSFEKVVGMMAAKPEESAPILESRPGLQSPEGLEPKILPDDG
jgi:DNA-binding MarR family transcriptional regulator